MVVVVIPTGNTYQPTLARSSWTSPCGRNEAAIESLHYEKQIIQRLPKDGAPDGWRVRRWDDVSKPADDGVVWKVEGGILHGSNPRGTWLMSEKEYGDFVLAFEFK